MEQENINPYAAPQTPAVAPQFASLTGAPDAGWGKRLLNLLLDYLAMMGIVFVIVFLAVFYEIADRSEQSQLLSIVDEYMNGVMLVCFILYYTLCEALFGRSFGKFITGTKVVTLSGAPITFRSALYRSFIRLLPFEPFSFFGSGFGNSAGRGWHDRWTSTRVVDLHAAPVAKPLSVVDGDTTDA